MTLTKPAVCCERELTFASERGFGNIPSDPALWFCFAWLALGYSLRSP